MTTTDRTKIETGDQQSERTGLTREPSISYGENGRVIRANDLGDRTPAQDNALVEAQLQATGNRRDDVQSEQVPSDLSDVGDSSR